MLKKVFSMGHLHRDEYSSLSNVMTLRNTISRGFATPHLQQEAFNLVPKATDAVLTLLSVSA